MQDPSRRVASPQQSNPEGGDATGNFQQQGLFADWRLPVTRANPSPLLESNRDKLTNVFSGRRCFALLQNQSLLSCLVKTLMASSVWHSNACVLTWKASALRSRRLLFRLVPSMRRTDEIEFGLLPTIRAADADRGGRGDLIQAARGNQNKHFRLLRTPTVSMINADRAKDPEYAARKLAKGQTITLSDQIRLLPTPRAIYGEHPGMTDPKHLTGAVREGLSQKLNGSLNPRFVEQMMGYPVGWTETD